MQNSITAFDAKTHFSKILDRASKGEEILVTRRGKAAAKIVPINTIQDIEIAEMAAVRLRKLAKEINLQPSDLEEWKKYRDVGKK
ncbi:MULTISPECIES: type II toxin-antitoxin system Phd/YefM family antitoxin [unclassified Candidatus Tisiphia]|uniref:type II toxin-antitoxin system Phd/YefM family antitoxin n=1 Tax=unclassified Candidatus Tisiphia TaxID=2996318 RepID=UPI001E7E3855|nr:MAG: type II toxin-antitoxin system Phd/YefM family antitoxin [Rickettsia endosymbiont of Cimex lectularius]